MPLSVSQTAMEKQTGECHIGDKCLSPISKRGKTPDARIRSIKSDKQGGTSAVTLSMHPEEHTIQIKELCKVQDSKDPWKSVIFDDADLEKPLFPDKRHSGPAVAFNLSNTGDSIPYTINRYLRDYQREGVQFMHRHYTESRGCILGDDMGLGKTVQVIAFLAAVLHKKGTCEDIDNNRPEFLLRTIKKESSSVTPKKMFLIVSPLSVLYNWKDELETWGYFRVITLHGNKKDTSLSRVRQGKCEVVLTTYETLRLCLDDLNRAVPGCLGSRTQFKEQYSSPVEHGQRHNGTKRELATGRKVMQRLVRKMSAFFLRRTKAIISHQLPKKDDRIVYCALTDFQRAVYQTVLETEDVGLVLRAREPCSCDSGRKRKTCCFKKNSFGETVKALYFSYLAILRKVANHTALLQTDSSTSKKQDTLIKRVCSQVFAKFPDFAKQSKDAAFETISDPIYSGKMKVLQQLLNHFRKNKDKVLLFSFSTKLLDVLEQYCMASGLDYRRLDGSTKPEERVKIVKEFNSAQDVNICLVSTMAGGLGLNFVGANVVVVFDPTWNPANDLQAIDRAYRIGQCRDVKVFRLISLGTVEEIVYLRQVYKQQLHCAVVGSENAKRYFEAVQGSKDHQGELFGVHNLFKLRPKGSCLTREILEREGKVEAGYVTTATRFKEDFQTSKLELPVEPEIEDEDHIIPVRAFTKDTFDFNSDSEDEAKAAVKSEATKSRYSNSDSAINPKEQLTLLQCGFSKLLDREAKPSARCSDNGSNFTDNKHMAEATPTGRKIAYQKYELPSNIRAKKFTMEHHKDEVCLEQNSKQEMANIRNHTPNWKLLSDSEEEMDSEDTKCHQKSYKEYNVVLETESGSEEGDSALLPCKVTKQQENVLNRTSEGAETTSGESENSSAENINTGSMGGDMQVASKKLFFPCVRSFFHKTKSITMNSVQKAKRVGDHEDISDESDDIEISGEPQTKKNSKLTFKPTKDKRMVSYPYSMGSDTHSQTIDAFSSSDDDLPTKKVRFRRQDPRQKRPKSHIQVQPVSKRHFAKSNVVGPVKINLSPIQNTSLKESTTVRKEAVEGSLDRILDGVQEVAYVHSNQNVVGSSKAENHMSRRAVRDVFELKQFSQFPANVAINISQRSEELSDEDQSGKVTQGKELNDQFQDSTLYVTHPVIQRNKRVHQAGPTTFLIGETPRGIRRKQFTEMASHFQMTSAEEFAEQIVRARSENRQQMLKDFYSSNWPKLKDIFTIQVPVELPSSFEENVENRLKHKRKKSRFKEGASTSTVSDEHSSSGTTEFYSQKQQQTRAVQVTYDSNSNHSVCLDANKRASPSAMAHADTSQEMSHILEDHKSLSVLRDKPVLIDAMTVGEITETTSDVKSPQSTSLNKKGNKSRSQAAERDSIADLLGDTSILDDLFKSRGSNLATSARQSHKDQPTVKARTKSKDFWDILNEQDGESFSKLTDPSVVEEVCERASPSITKEKQVCSLWRKNENFLWRKYDPSHDHDQDLPSS
ncbi:DNA excision repair protein ERCC-6-like 2 isoform X2 [Ambystoma mexicanum]|uniref:DNA excision repair protein ERCC-6-like 2 isoform X2 n=1 Tax=Ambystoma mexicanum TaxID=8296 RepID=UPI0037E7D834